MTFMSGKAVLLMLALALASSVAAQAQPIPDRGNPQSRQAPDAQIEIGGGVIDIVFSDGAPGIDRALVQNWIRTSAQAVTTYFGRFPVSHVRLVVIAGDGRSVGGTTFGFRGGSLIRLNVGRGADAAALKRDWVLVHEMTHLALPQLPRWALWLQEGNATYVEPIARAQAGQMDVAEVWKWTIDEMPGGQPKPGEGGLNDTQDHQRTYWGGAAFWLVADVRIRERTHNRIGVQTALQAINRQSGGNIADWTMEQVMAAGDTATGGTELADLYTQMGKTGSPVDIHALLVQLGVGLQGNRVVFDDNAPLAAIRRQITALPA
ncbi:MAG: hypothetical protein V4559_04460 [Pseudomonadota bacterium]